MKNDSSHDRIWKFCLISLLQLVSLAIATSKANTQNITLDGTIGPTKILTGPIYEILQTDGYTVDKNLFHSFGRFNLSEGETARFHSNTAIHNILARVTGGEPSNINGLIYTTSGSVNLFLMNPSGIVFGSNARLDVGGISRGSFIATTLDTLTFPNGGQFSVINPGGPSSLLTLVGDPSGFLSSLRPPGSIINRSQLLDVYPGQTLLLLGGDIKLDAGTLKAPGGQVELGSLSETGAIQLNQAENSWWLSVPNGIERSRVELSNNSLIDVSTSDDRIAGDVHIEAQNVSLTNSEILSRSTNNATEGFGTIGISATGGSVLVDQNSLISASNFGNPDQANYGLGYGGDVQITASNQVSILNNSRIFSQGNRGNIFITAGSFQLANNAELQNSSFREGIVGSITINTSANSGVSIVNSRILSQSANSSTDGFGTIGISATGGSVLIDQKSLVNASNSDSGFAGDISISALEQVFVSNGSRISARGNFGRIFIGESELYASFSPQIVNIDQSTLSTDNSSSGSSTNINAGNISVQANDSIFIQNRSELISNTLQQGNAGDILLLSSRSITLDNSIVFSNVKPGAIGDAGDIGIGTQSFLLTNGAQLQSSVLGSTDTQLGGRGDSGIIVVVAPGSATLSGQGTYIFTDVEFGAQGNAGGIGIRTGSLMMTDNANLVASTAAQQDTAGNLSHAGIISLQVDGAIRLVNSNIFNNLESGAVGEGGDIEIEADSLALTDGAQIQTLVRESDLETGRPAARGNAGNVTINVHDSVFLSGVNQLPSAIFSDVNPGTSGDAGVVSISARRVLVQEGGRISSSTESTGKGGTLTIVAPESVELLGTAIDGRFRSQLTTDTWDAGAGGNLTIHTGRLLIRDGALATASTSGAGQGGQLSITADTIEISGTTPDGQNSSGLSTETYGAGTGGNLILNTDQLMIRNGGGAGASTFGAGSSGNLTVNASEFVELTGVSADGQTGSFLAAGAGEEATGAGGNLTIATSSLRIRDKAAVTVSHDGRGRAGNLAVSANLIQLENQGRITAETASGEGGNITLTIADFLFMRHNSQISATAGTAQQGGNGGNITINIPAGFIIAIPQENSDITANAFTGQGGNVNITAQGVIGIDFRERITPWSDITASSEFGLAGNVQLNLPNVAVENALVELPTGLINPDRLVARSCIARRNARQGSFVVTGQGGLPSTPSGNLSGWFEVPDSQTIGSNRESGNQAADNPATSEQSIQRAIVEASTSESGDPIHEAQGILVLPNGQIALVTESQGAALGTRSFEPVGTLDGSCN